MELLHYHPSHEKQGAIQNVRYFYCFSMSYKGSSENIIQKCCIEVINTLHLQPLTKQAILFY